MKLVVFAHTPPPHHGQSHMVELLLEALGGDVRHPSAARPVEPGFAGEADRLAGIQCYHINCRLSDDLEDIGRARGGKVFPLLKYCLEAIWLRVRHGADHFYYVPASACRLGMMRDWIIMALCRPFFRKIICHWHAGGLGVWLQNEARPWERGISRLLLFRPHLGIVLGEFNRRDAEAVLSRRVVVVPNGIRDPIPTFDLEVRPRRQARAVERSGLAAQAGKGISHEPPHHVFSVLFMGLCCREKGLFDAVNAVVLANRLLEVRAWPIRVQMKVAGTFWHKSEQEEFEKRLQKPDLAMELADEPGASGGIRRQPAVEYLGFVRGDDKRRLMVESDCFCLPTYYSSETFGLVLLEAMAFGLPVIATRWRNLPELLPSHYPGLVEPREPSQIAEAIMAHLQAPSDAVLRDRFLACYTREKFVRNMRAALQD